MSGLKEIRRRIGSIKNTKQITRAMKLVSAAKLKRAQDAAVASRHYGEKLRDVLTSVVLFLDANHSHRLMEQRSEGPRRVVVVAGERGLCGAYNTNVMKAVIAQQEPDDEYVAVGRRAVAGLKRLGVNIVATFEGLPEDPSKWPIAEIADQVMLDFAEGRCREVAVLYTRFVSALNSEVTSEVVLPVSREHFLNHPAVAALGGPEEIERHYQSQFDIPPTELFEQFVPFAIRAKIREATLEAKASEHAARMTAMDNATRNASDLIERLRLFYNRARQSAITRELIDIVGGAEAVK